MSRNRDLTCLDVRKPGLMPHQSHQRHGRNHSLYLAQSRQDRNGRGRHFENYPSYGSNRTQRCYPGGCQAEYLKTWLSCRQRYYHCGSLNMTSRYWCDQICRLLPALESWWYYGSHYILRSSVHEIGTCRSLLYRYGIRCSYRKPPGDQQRG